MTDHRFVCEAGAFGVRARADYEAAQILRSRQKATVCHVDEADVVRYRQHLEGVRAILCLGVRNGREVDRFAAVFDCPVQGVELCPDLDREDVWIGSYDALPAEWAARYDLVFSNSLDHAWDVRATVREWQRVLAPGGTLIVALNGHATPTDADCAQFTILDLCLMLEQCELVRQDEGHYPEAWFRKAP